ATHYDRACDAFVAEGCTSLGVMHGAGVGVVRDVNRQETLLRRGCANGDPVACNNLGGVYSRMPATLTTQPRAPTIYKLSCAVVRVGCSGWERWFNVSTGLDVKRLADAGVTSLSVESRKLFEQACRAGEKHACVNLGALLYQGFGGEPDPDAAYD